ncbi:hypothetical protein R83H12_02039 [Fibrobacteria bacterium R8-3-H12]
MTLSSKTHLSKPPPEAPNSIVMYGQLRMVALSALLPINPDNSAVRWALPTARFFYFCGRCNSGKIGTPLLSEPRFSGCKDFQDICMDNPCGCLLSTCE